MADLIQINNGEVGNLLSYKSLLKDDPTISYIGNTGVGTITNERIINPNCLSYKMYEVQNVITGLNTQFSFGDALQYTTVREGNHTFSFFISKGNINANPDYNVDVSLKLYINSVLNETYTKNIPLVSDGIDFRFAQSFNLNEGDEINFAFEVNKASVGTPNPNIELYFTCFQLNYGNVCNYNIPFEQITGYNSRVDTTNTISLTADVDNLVSITGDMEQNGSLILMNSNSKITPIKVGDVLQIDFTCTFVTPAGDNKNVVVKLIVDGVAYRSFTYPLTKGAGNDDEFSISWSLPCGSAVVDNGAEIFINPMEAMTNKNRYISATRTHKGV